MHDGGRTCGSLRNAASSPGETRTINLVVRLIGMRELRVGNGVGRCEIAAAASADVAIPSVATRRASESAARWDWARGIAGAVLAFGATATATSSGLPGLLVADASFWLGETDPMASGVWAIVWGLGGALGFLYVHRLRGRTRRLVSHNQSLVRELAVQRDDDEHRADDNVHRADYKGHG